MPKEEARDAWDELLKVEAEILSVQENLPKEKKVNNPLTVPFFLSEWKMVESLSTILCLPREGALSL